MNEAITRITEQLTTLVASYGMNVLGAIITLIFGYLPLGNKEPNPYARRCSSARAAWVSAS